MKAHHSLLLSLIVLCSAPLVHAGNVTYPELRGKLYNRTAYAAESFALHIEYVCVHPKHWWGGPDEACGVVKSVATFGPVQADGSRDIVFPAVEMDEPGFGTRAVLAFVTYDAPTGAGEKPDPFDLLISGRTKFRLRLNGADERDSYDKLGKQVASISLYQFPRQPIRFLNSDGSDAISYLRSIYGAQDNLRIFIETTEPSTLIWAQLDNLPVSLGAGSFGNPIESLVTSGYFKLSTGAPPVDHLVLKLTARNEPADWRDYNWGRSWMVVYETEARLEVGAFPGVFPTSFTRIPVSESWKKR